MHASDTPFPAGGFPTRNKVETPAPAPAGTRERIVIENLQPDRSYYVVLRTADEVFNWSIPSSDTVATSPPPDLVHPGTVTTLLMARQSQTSITVEWEATGDAGDIGVAHHYDVRYAPQAITEADWESASPVDGEPIPGIP